MNWTKKGYTCELFVYTALNLNGYLPTILSNIACNPFFAHVKQQVHRSKKITPWWPACAPPPYCQ